MSENIPQNRMYWITEEQLAELAAIANYKEPDYELRDRLVAQIRTQITPPTPAGKNL